MKEHGTALQPRRTGSGKQLFIKNAFILTATSLILRGAGMYFRIYVSSLMGAEGVGLYQLIMSVYTLASGFAASGLTVAVTRMTADELACGTKQSLRRVMRRCMAAGLIMGLLSSAALVLLARPIGGGWISDPRSVLSVKIMAGALPFMSLSCCMRGYFTARRRAGVPSAAQIAEQSARIILALVLLHRWMPLGAEFACAAIILADVISEGVGCLYVCTAYLLERRKHSSLCGGAREHVPAPQVNSVLWKIAAPITASHYLTTLLRTVESVLVPDCLTRAELSRTRALELFGLVKGMALPLVLFPSTLLTAFSSLLVPEISQAQTLGNKRMVCSAVRRTMQITLTLSIPVGGLFMLYPNELGQLVYNDSRIGPIIMVLAPLMPLMYAESVVVGILRGLDEQSSTLRYGVLDSVVRIILITAAVPRFGLAGFLAVMVVSNLLTPLLSIRRLTKVTGVSFDWAEWLIKPLCALLPAVLTAMLIKFAPFFAALPALWQMATGGCAALAVYAAVMLIFLRPDPRTLRTVLGR